MRRDVREHRHLRLHQRSLGAGRGTVHGRRRRPGRVPGAVASARSAVPGHLDAHERVPGVGVEHVLARSAVRDVVAADAVIGTQKSRPRPPCTMSDPESPRMASPAGAALDVVVGAPPVTRSVPRPPTEIVGVGSPVDPIVAPASASSPLRPQITSRLGVPRRTSLPFVPEIVHPDGPAGSSGARPRPPERSATRRCRRRPATAPVTRRCRRSPPCRGSARRSRRWRAW